MGGTVKKIEREGWGRAGRGGRERVSDGRKCFFILVNYYILTSLRVIVNRYLHNLEKGLIHYWVIYDKFMCI